MCFFCDSPVVFSVTLIVGFHTGSIGECAFAPGKRTTGLRGTRCRAFIGGFEAIGIIPAWKREIPAYGMEKVVGTVEFFHGAVGAIVQDISLTGIGGIARGGIAAHRCRAVASIGACRTEKISIFSEIDGQITAAKGFAALVTRFVGLFATGGRFGDAVVEFPCGIIAILCPGTVAECRNPGNGVAGSGKIRDCAWSILRTCTLVDPSFLGAGNRFIAITAILDPGFCVAGRAA